MPVFANRSNLWGFAAMCIRIAVNVAALIAIEILLKGRNPYLITLIELSVVYVCDAIDSLIPQAKFGWLWVREAVYEDAAGHKFNALPPTVDDDPLQPGREYPRVTQASLSEGIVHGPVFPWNAYEESDKVVDTAMSAVVLILHLRRVHGFVSMFEWVFLGLFLYRLIGVILFEVTGKSIFLVYFFNFWELMMLYLFLKYVLHVRMWILWVIMIVAFPIKILNEWLLHVYYNPQK